MPGFMQPEIDKVAPIIAIRAAGLAGAVTAERLEVGVKHIGKRRAGALFIGSNVTGIAEGPEVRADVKEKRVDQSPVFQ